jgi:3D (Asp-Asp-Asp) domain-containing protein
MNKTITVSDVSEPPLLMLFLAAFSLVFNLCFPQYTAQAHAEGQKFVQENGLKENRIALNEAKSALAAQQAAIQQQTEATVQVAAVPAVRPEDKKVIKMAAAKAKSARVKSAAMAVKTAPAVQTTVKGSHFVTVTAYSSTVDQCDSSPFITASGTRVRDGIIATNLLAFGTKVKFPSLYGDKIFIVEDRMNQRFSNRADIWFETREQAKKFGVRKLEMVIVS